VARSKALELALPRAKTKARAESPARDRILGAATKLFTKKPFDQISATDIAKEAGVAHGLTFHYFGSKERLYEEVSQAAADALDIVHEAATRNGNPNERLIAFLDVHMDEILRRRVDYVFHSRGGASPKIQSIWEASRHNAIVLILGFYGNANPSPQLETAIRAWLGYFDELVLAWVQGGIKNRKSVIEMTLRMFPIAVQNAALLGAKDIPIIK
jgi:AcrR family transcriptional regulator